MPNAYKTGLATNMSQPMPAASLSNSQTLSDGSKFIAGARMTPSSPLGGGGPEREFTDRGWAYNQGGAQGAGYYYNPSNSEKMLNQQQYFAKDFRDKLPQMENQMGNQAAGSIGASADQGVRASRASDSSRGLLYGGVHAGHEGAIRGEAAAEMAGARSNINQGLLSAADSMDANAIQTGVAVQQQQQQMQNAIYSQAMAKMNAENASFGGLMSAGGMLAGGYLAGR
jgi:hypothetical protein